MPTRSLRSETGFQSFVAFGSSGARSKPGIGFSWDRAAWGRPAAAAPSPSVWRKARRVKGPGGVREPGGWAGRWAEFMGAKVARGQKESRLNARHPDVGGQHLARDGYQCRCAARLALERV